MKVRLLAAAGAAILLAMTGAAHAATYDYSYSGADGSFQFTDNSNPTPYYYAQGSVFYLTEMGNIDGQNNQSLHVEFFNSNFDGGLYLYSGAHSINFYDPQLYSGLESAPTFTPGVYSTSSVIGGPITGSFTVAASASAVSAAPEPAAWMLMLTGLGGIGLAFRQVKRRHGCGSAKAVPA